MLTFVKKVFQAIKCIPYFFCVFLYVARDIKFRRRRSTCAVLSSLQLSLLRRTRPRLVASGLCRTYSQRSLVVLLLRYSVMLSGSLIKGIHSPRLYNIFLEAENTSVYFVSLVHHTLLKFSMECYRSVYL